MNFTNFLSKMLGAKTANAPAPYIPEYPQAPENFLTNITPPDPKPTPRVKGAATANPSATKPVNKNIDMTKFIADAARKAGYKPELLHALVMAESEGNPKAKSGKRAYGLTQITPVVMKDLGLPSDAASMEKLYDPQFSMATTIQALNKMKTRYPEVFNNPVDVYKVWNTGNPGGTFETNAQDRFVSKYVQAKKLYKQ